MPEGPEVYNMVSKINKKIKNKTLSDIILISGRYKNHDKPKNYKKFKKLLPLKINNINNKGKFIWIDFKNSEMCIWITLGLTGELSFTSDKYTRVEFFINDISLYYNDIRNFGTIKFDIDIESKLKKLGPDPLYQIVTIKYFDDKLNKFNQNEIIGDILLNQSLISGVGNYIRAESLYDADINPFIKIKKLSYNDRKILLLSIVKIIKKFQKNPNMKFKVYRNKNASSVESPKGRTLYYIK